MPCGRFATIRLPLSDLLLVRLGWSRSVISSAPAQITIFEQAGQKMAGRAGNRSGLEPPREIRCSATTPPSRASPSHWGFRRAVSRDFPVPASPES